MPSTTNPAPADRFIEMIAGVGASRVPGPVRPGRSRTRAIIFIDEVDAAGRSRGGSISLGEHDEREQTPNQILTERDGFTGSEGVVMIAVIVQDGTVPWLIRRLRIPQRSAEPKPWSMGIRFRHEPEGLHRFVVDPGSPADRSLVCDLHLAGDAWVSLIIRDGRLLPVRAGTVLRAGDEAVLLADGGDDRELSAPFTASTEGITTVSRKAGECEGARVSHA